MPDGTAAPGVRSDLPTLPGVTELRFRDFFRLPIGPRGLEPSAKLLALHGQAVRVVGYMVQMAEPPPGLLVLAPLPVSVGDEDESFADDLPASLLYVHLDDAAARVQARLGLLALQGRLDVGARREADGRISFVRLWLDATTSHALSLTPQPLPEKPHEPKR